MEKEPLVSIVVITYNSSKYVLEMLESAKAQTYQNIELIVSDDCSTDNTVEICKNWIEENKDRFVRTELITAEKNTGIPANCNRRVKAAQGEWVKLIAGDDILADTCMENIVGYSKVNPDAEIVDSCMQYFLREFKLENFGRYRSGNEEFFNTDISSSEQYNLLLRKNYISAPSVYIKKNILIKNNFFDEKYFIEDYPFFLKATKSGEKFYFMPKLSAYYRAHQQSASLNVDNDKLFTDFYKKMLSFDREQRIPYLKWYEILKYYYRYYLKCVINQLNMNKNNLFCRCIFELLYYSPIVHINTLKNKIYNRIQKN